jgi:hypothetical protein
MNNVVGNISLDGFSRTGDPTYLLNALQSTDNLKQLGYTSNLQDCLKAHVDGAPTIITAALATLPSGKVIAGDAGECITTAFKAIHTPTKMTPILASSSTPATPDAENASDLSTRAGIAASAKTTNASLDKDIDPMKHLLDSAKLSQIAGPMISFLRGIINGQSALFKAHVELLGDEHPIFIAISFCDLPKFRSEFEKLFDKTYPRLQRKIELLKEISQLKINENEDLLPYRSQIIKLMKRCDELLSHHEFIAHKEGVMHDFLSSVMENINMIRNYETRIEITSKFVGVASPTIGYIIEVLQSADKTLRSRNPTGYPPKPIPIHNALESTSGKVGGGQANCLACKQRWGKSWPHTLATCLGNPGNPDAVRWSEKWNERCVRDGKQPAIFKGTWPAFITTLDKPVARSNNKRSTDGPRSATPPLKKERGI